MSEITYRTADDNESCLNKSCEFYLDTANQKCDGERAGEPAIASCTKWNKPSPEVKAVNVDAVMDRYLSDILDAFEKDCIEMEKLKDKKEVYYIKKLKPDAVVEAKQYIRKAFESGKNPGSDFIDVLSTGWVSYHNHKISAAIKATRLECEDELAMAHKRLTESEQEIATLRKALESRILDEMEFDKETACIKDNQYCYPIAQPTCVDCIAEFYIAQAKEQLNDKG